MIRGGKAKVVQINHRVVLDGKTDSLHLLLGDIMKTMLVAKWKKEVIRLKLEITRLRGVNINHLVVAGGENYQDHQVGGLSLDLDKKEGGQ